MTCSIAVDAYSAAGRLSDNAATSWAVKDWPNCARAKACGTLPALAGLEKTLDTWEKVLESATPYDEEFPSPYADLTPLQRLCVIRAVRFDALVAALEAFAAAELGQAEEDSALEKAASLDDESAPPIILRVSPEADDGREALQRVAEANGVRLVVVGADSHAARAHDY